MGEREYTPEEANGLLPEISESLLRIQQARRVIFDGGERLRRTARMNGGGAVSREYWGAIDTLRREIQDLVDRGIVLRDPESGLIDFPGRVEGQEAFLCWRLGEDRVEWWHRPDSGFSGRHRL